ncbi:hypothetical protein XA68_12610 [Ophiocordyceps unilateralis]|uniref:Uncharacterized protein n=1 Tax=Ophiocordyceps unilateralis TaxID=268505 RepID=A0A2A9PEF8_OPHUN|nr:hypothetical protein XA68_12610 [Ophiocordyceps unilateralis]
MGRLTDRIKSLRKGSSDKEKQEPQPPPYEDGRDLAVVYKLGELNRRPTLAYFGATLYPNKYDLENPRWEGFVHVFTVDLKQLLKDGLQWTEANIYRTRRRLSPKPVYVFGGKLGWCYKRTFALKELTDAEFAQWYASISIYSRDISLLLDLKLRDALSCNNVLQAWAREKDTKQVYHSEVHGLKKGAMVVETRR